MAYKDDALATDAVLSLLGMGLKHVTDVKAIRTQADLKRDQLAFDREKLAAQKKLELDKAMFTLRMDELKQLEAQRNSVTEEYTKRTGKIPDYPTTAFMDLHEESGDISTYEQALSEATERARLVEDDVKRQK